MNYTHLSIEERCCLRKNYNEGNLGQIANTATNTAESLQDTLTRCLLLTTKGLFMALVITISLPEMNRRINELLKQSIKSDGIINLFSDVKEEFSLFDPKFLAEISKMREKNIAIEILKKLIAEQIFVYRRTNVVKSEKFSEILQMAMNRYLNGLLTNEQVIEELLNMAKDIARAKDEGNAIGLTPDELAFYDALVKPQAIKDFYENDELIAITKELADTLRKNKTIDWQRRESARAKMRLLIKRLLKKHKYPPEGMDDAVQTVMTQCELWTDNVMDA